MNNFALLHMIYSLLFAIGYNLDFLFLLDTQRKHYLLLNAI